MAEQHPGMDDLLRDDQGRGLMFITERWLLMAVEQRSRNLTIDLAMSVPYRAGYAVLSAKPGKN